MLSDNFVFQSAKFFRSNTQIYSLINIGFLLLCFLLGLVYSVPRSSATLVAGPYYPPPSQLVHFTFGYSKPGADFLWLRALQDFEFCEKMVSEQECVSKGWLYKVLDLATELDEAFLPPHSYGALGLSVLASDKVGSALIFQKGVHRFPKEWSIAYWAGYHALYEEKNEAKAAELFHVAAKNGAPQWVYSLAGRLYTDSGKIDVADRMVSELESNNFDPTLLKRIKKKISKGLSKRSNP